MYSPALMLELRDIGVIWKDFVIQPSEQCIFYVMWSHFCKNTLRCSLAKNLCIFMLCDLSNPISTNLTYCTIFYCYCIFSRHSEQKQELPLTHFSLHLCAFQSELIDQLIRSVDWFEEWTHLRPSSPSSASTERRRSPRSRTQR